VAFGVAAVTGRAGRPAVSDAARVVGPAVCPTGCPAHADVTGLASSSAAAAPPESSAGRILDRRREAELRIAVSGISIC
jgi:hypothetical protein